MKKTNTTIFKCKDILNKEITIYHATNQLSTNLKRGYVGGSDNFYCSLVPNGLLELLKNTGKYIDGKMIPSPLEEVAVFKIDNVPTRWLYIDWEPCDAIWFHERELLNKWNHKAVEVFSRILESRFSSVLVPLQDFYPLCEELGEDQIIKREMGWMRIPNGRKIRIAEEYIIEQAK